MTTPRIRHELTIEQVQRWVVSFLILAVSSFPLGALVAVIHTIVGEGRNSDGIILLVVMGCLGVLALGAIRLVHRRTVFVPWLVLGTLPAVIAAFFIF
ncbi:hypothetical protein C6I20_12535 [Aeromicrobium sp. A1-2]|uniref:hypothetical protein n=1 Tax=Aeromicrobium sp. A1-2 TaxID=2107713 RepID=UPI000E4EC4CB|nr:hypothetical protein [Aeromicrobium sp. A1-2]AXT85926.1 hypothetical protein C6I20_12535 [Aeromicrobium sp. A1-2]